MDDIARAHEFPLNTGNEIHAVHCVPSIRNGFRAFATASAENFANS